MIQMSKPFLGSDEINAVAKVLNDGYLGCGLYVSQFEEQLKTYLNREVACVSSGTSALHLSLEAMGIGTGDEVIVQSLTFIATFQAAAVTGAKVIPCDINSDDLSIDLTDAETKISKRTKAIIPVHYAGYPGLLDEVYSFAKKKNLRVIEDAAHSFGGKYNDKLVGSIGDVVCFSFDPVKSVTCGEGGAVVSDDIHLIQKVKEMRLLGLNNKNCLSSSKVYSNTGVSERGWRYHMNNINASIGMVQLSKLDHFAAIRRHLIAKYVYLLKKNKHIEILPYDYEKIGHYIFVVTLKDVDSEVVIQEMKNRGIECGNHYYPPHLNPYFRKFYPYPLPAVEKIYKTLLTLPLHTGLTEKDILLVVENLEEILENNAGAKKVITEKT